MQTIPERRPRRVVSNEEVADALWRGLWSAYRADRRYQSIVRQDLAPLWREAKRAKGWGGDHRPDLDAVVDQYLGALDDRHPGRPTGTYVVGLLVCASERLRITEEDTWSFRAAGEIHDDVTGRTARRMPVPAPNRAADDDLLTVTVTISANSVQYQTTGRDPNGNKVVVAQDDYSFGGLGFGYDPDHWRAVAEAGCEVVQNNVDRIHRVIEDTHPALNQSAIDRWPEDLALLVRCLFHREPLPEKADRERLRRLCGRLGIDFRHGRDRPRAAVNKPRAAYRWPDRLIAPESSAPPAA